MTYKMYNGNEKLYIDSKETSYSMMDFWRWTLSCIHDSTTRGSFAEHIVKCALDEAGYKYNDEPKTGMELYDLDGPVIPSTGEKARIEVKCTGYFRINPHVGFLRTKNQRFDIKKKRVPDETGDFQDDSIPQRNNDIYVLSVYNATEEDQDIFDLSLWDFYVLPTFWLDQDPKWRDCASISLKSVQGLCERHGFYDLPNSILEACKLIPPVK